MSWIALVFLTPGSGVGVVAAPDGEGAWTNSIGMELVPIPAGRFQMGFEGDSLPEELMVFEPARYSDSLRAKHPKEDFGGTRRGLVGVVFPEAELTGESVAEREFHVGNGFDWPLDRKKAREDTRSARWRGRLQVPGAGTIQFRVECEPGVRLKIGNVQVVQGWEDTQARAGEVSFAAAATPPVVLEYKQPRTLERLRVFWRLPGQAETLVPASALFHTAEDRSAAVDDYSFLPAESHRRLYLTQGDYDEVPRREVSVSRPFLMSRTEVTLEQYRQFRPDHYESEAHYRPYVAGISWYDAVAFCEWLSKKEGKHYRLPTEAEWEYACRGGTQTPFYSGKARLLLENAQGQRSSPPHPWGLENLHSGVAEWCHDWYDAYPEEPEIDPVGPAAGWLKVVRGGGLDFLSHDVKSNYYLRPMRAFAAGAAAYFARSANRAAVPPSFAPPPAEFRVLQRGAETPPTGQLSPHHERIVVSGRHGVGFRVVEASPPATKPRPFVAPWALRCVKQSEAQVTDGPDSKQPYYRARRMFPELDTETVVNVGWKIGLPPGFGSNQHTSGLGALPNGDLFAVFYNGFAEKDPDLSLLAVRLRRGADSWDNPCVWPDLIDVNDASPVLWADGRTLRLFWGGLHMAGAYPFQMSSSRDNGATWTPIEFPVFEGRPGGHRRRQPSATAFRLDDNTMYVGFDGWGGTSGLWGTTNNGKTWFDAGGRTRGLHTVFTPIAGGAFLGIGPRNLSIEGYAGRNVSKDRGKTWETTRAPLPAQGGGQRPFLLRLASGRLFYVSDFTRSEDPNVQGFSSPGGYAGLSEDDGKTWRIRKLHGTGIVGSDGQETTVHTVGYASASQSPNGIVHVVSTRNSTKLHYEMNEAWILAEPPKTEPPAAAEAEIVAGSEKLYREEYPGGAIRVTWAQARGADGRVVLHGTETWYYENGQKEWEVTYSGGRKVGTETYWYPGGGRNWRRKFRKDGTHNWRIWSRDGTRKARSIWRGLNLLKHDF